MYLRFKGEVVKTIERVSQSFPSVVELALRCQYILKHRLSVSVS